MAALVAFWLLLTLRPGQPWDGDFALYVMNARNIVLGTPYAETAYLVNPANVIHPAAYPPGTPLLLAPIYALFGIDLTAMKSVCIVAFAVFLFAFSRTANAALSPTAGLLLAGLVGFHPYFWQIKDSLGSEFPFLMFCYGGLLFIDRIDRGATSPGQVAAAAICVAMAYLTRTAGIVLFPAVVLIAMRSEGAVRRRLLLTTALAAALAAFTQWRYPADVGTYVGYFDAFSLPGMWETAQQYLNVSTQILGKAVLADREIRNLAFGALVAIAVYDIVRRLRTRFTIYEVFFGGYGVMLLIYPITLEPDRYSMPLWPLLLLYAASGGLRLMRPLRERRRNQVAALAAVAVVGLYVAQYHRQDFGPIRYSVDSQPAQDLYAAIEAQMRPDEVIITRGPTVIGLYTGRRSTIWPSHRLESDEEFWRYARDVGATHFVRAKVDLDLPRNWLEPVTRFVKRNEHLLIRIHSNDWFDLYRFAAIPPAAGDS